MFESHEGHRLICEKAVRPHLRPSGPQVYSSFPVSGGQIRRGCQFLHGLFSLWAIFLVVLPDLFPVSLVLTTPGFCISCGYSVDMASPPDHGRVVISRLRSLSWTSLVTL